jgi:hemerythrin superfamily protein
MNIYEALKMDHRKVESLMENLLDLPDGDHFAADDLIHQIRDELLPHSHAEEAVLYNSIRAIDSARDLIWHSYGEHMEVEALLRSLHMAEEIDVDWRSLASQLQNSLLHHIDEEENRILPIAEQLFSEEEADRMATSFFEIKKQMREGSMVQATLDLVASLLPVRLAAPLRSLHLNPRQ